MRIDVVGIVWCLRVGGTYVGSMCDCVVCMLLIVWSLSGDCLGRFLLSVRCVFGYCLGSVGVCYVVCYVVLRLFAPGAFSECVEIVP